MSAWPLSCIARTPFFRMLWIAVTLWRAIRGGFLEVIFAADSDDALVNRTDYTQPAVFAVEYALAQLMKS